MIAAVLASLAPPVAHDPLHVGLFFSLLAMGLLLAGAVLAVALLEHRQHP